MNLREAERLQRAIEELHAGGLRGATATVLRIEGSFYRRQGARMLVRPDGSWVGALSGGCLEPDLAASAARVIAGGEPARRRYDLADDSLWGLGLGCAGIVEILLERTGDDPVAARWIDALARGEAGALVTPLSGAAGRRLRLAGGEVAGRLSDPAVERAADALVAARLAAPHPASGIERAGAAELFVELNPAPPALLIFGAGHDAVPLAREAWALGFSVTVVDPRAALLVPERFPGARLVAPAVGAPDEAIRPPPHSFVVVMNHHLERDRRALALALSSDAAYVGMLGPRRRTERLLAEIEAGGTRLPADARERLRSPVGLAIGAETPEEVALSILAEILAVRRGFGGGPLHGSGRAIHAPDAG